MSGGNGFDCRLEYLEVEGLRGFQRTQLTLRRPVTVLVGPNNAGKTSLLRLLNWALVGVDDDLLRGERRLREDEERLLLPARDTRGARRLVLGVAITDRRRWSRFHVDQGVARLRLQVIGSAVYAATTPPRRNEKRKSQDAACELWKNVRGQTLVVLVPAARDAASPRFRETLALAARARLEERALHARQGGAPAEYRQLKKTTSQIERLAAGLVQPLWKTVHSTLPPGMARSGHLTFDVTPQALVDWLVTQVQFRLTTGPHDERAVDPSEVGSGLQSLLDLALLQVLEELGPDALLLIEEPEAFLHPSAQRTMAGKLLSHLTAVRRVISTHSPIIVDEAQYGDVVLVREHKVHEPTIQESKRSEINSALLTGQGAEALYSRSVLFVEGPGDRAFFEALRRRIAERDDSGRADQLAVVFVGGKQRFAAWMQLIQGYVDGSASNPPIRWLAVADGVDAAPDLVRGARAAGLTLPNDVDRHLTDIGRAFGRHDIQAGIAACRSFNNSAALAGTALQVVPVDLEWSALELASEATTKAVARVCGVRATSKEDLLRKLGSKVLGRVADDARKDPWMRTEIGRGLPWEELSDDIRGILRRWLGGAIEDASEVERLLRPRVRRLVRRRATRHP